MCELLDTGSSSFELFLFPDECRSYRECVVFGRRRKTALTDAPGLHRRHTEEPRYQSMFGSADRQARSPGEPQFSRWRYAEPDSASRKPELDTWELPFSVPPKRFQKTALTERNWNANGSFAPLRRLRQRTLSPLKRPAAVAEQRPHEPAAHDRDARRLCAQLAAPRGCVV